MKEKQFLWKFESLKPFGSYFKIKKNKQTMTTESSIYSEHYAYCRDTSTKSVMRKASSSVHCVIMGAEGVGKTKLVEKACQADDQVPLNLKTGFAGATCTTSAIKLPAAHGDHEMCLTDTPGQSPAYLKFSNALELWVALTSSAVTSIMLAVKIDRDGKMVNEINQQIAPVAKFRNKIILCVTHLDESKKPVKDTFDNIRKLFEDQFGMSNILCVGEHTKPHELCNAIYNISCRMITETLIIHVNDFKYKFDIKSNNKNEQKKKLEEAVEDFKSFVDEITVLAKEAPAAEKDDVAYAASIEIKKEAETKAKNYAEEFGAEMEEKDNYLNYVTLKKETLALVEAGCLAMESLMSFNSQDRSDLRNFYRRCPFCGEIWAKVEGCDGETSCGKRPTVREASGQPFYAIVFTRLNNKLCWNKNKKPDPRKFNKYENVGHRKIGCGNKFVWKNLPILTAQELQDISKVDVTDFLADRDDFKGQNEKLLEEQNKVRAKGKLNC